MLPKLVVVFGFSLLFCSSECFEIQKLLIGGRMYEHEQPVLLNSTACYSRESSYCHLYKRNLCNSLIDLLPEPIAREATCTNKAIFEEPSGTFRMEYTMLFKSVNPIMKGIDVTCSTFTALYVMAMKEALLTGRKMLGEPIVIEPAPRIVNWDGNTVDFQIRGTLLIDDIKLRIEKLGTLHASVVKRELYQMRGIHKMIQPIFKKENILIKDPTFVDVNGYVGVELVVTYNKTIIQAMKLDPNCITFTSLLQYGLRTPVPRTGYQLGADTNVTMITEIDTPEEYYPDESDEKATVEPKETDEDKGEPSSVIENTESGDSGSRSSCCIVLILAALMVLNL